MAPRTKKTVEGNNLDVTQQQVKNLLYKRVKITYHTRGRELSDTGVITAVFGKIFTFEYERNGQKFKSSFTYTDVMTGGISIAPEE
ncbi:MAG: hypothetical protein IIY51_04260 [Erysipelotrichaceae bacterium]|nr:hypothetical protein [Erysipelotrichaceae bacterium]MBQ2213889.1 hypothetical protein [Erysipelotrichaceae bacterium]MBR2599626.1 hypothetical protein [Erysipelotrichaceae bacterium]MBR2792968.1 hypothetical protein [Erysipelotrichaceae bacterium]MBR2826467.1 hypothetical protein [Erysipelotrichaceae bacterium]